MKKLLCWALALCMALSLFPVGTRAAEIVDSGSCGENVTYTLDRDGLLTITGTGDIKDFGYYMPPWSSGVRKAVIQKGVTGIGSGAFSGCSNLTEVTLPEGLERIGEGAFEWDSFLKKIDFPNSLKTIEKKAFMYCTQLESLSLNNCSDVEQGAFASCVGLKTIDLGKSELDFHNAFGVDNISAETLGKLQTIRVDPANKKYAVKDNTLYSKDGKTLVYRPGGLTEAFRVPENVTTIGPYAFGCSHASAIDLGSKVTNVAYGAFYGVKALKQLEIPDSVKTLEGAALQYSETLEHAVLPEGLTKIPYRTFRWEFALKTVYIPGSVTEIAAEAFDVLFDEVTPDIYFGGTEAQWKAIKGVDEVPDTYHIHFNHTHTWDAGTVTKEAAVGVAGEKVFHCTVCTKSKAETIPALPGNGTRFTDVKDSDYFAEAVAWAVEKGITDGTTDTTFSPAADCTRGQMVTFLWRAAECPEPTKTDNPFTDVKESDYFYKAVLWAVENGITDGTSATTFSPDATCTRAHVVTFLWRVENKPAPGSKNPFADVASGEWYSEAVLWAVSKAITDGTSETTFSPSDSCTRGQIVTFLWRDMK